MKHASRRPRSFAPAALLATVTLGWMLALTPACSTAGRRAQKAGSAEPIYLAPLHVELGRVLSYDAKAGTALVEIASFAKVPAKLAGQTLVARNPATLEQTARLVASIHRTGSVFGAYVIEGKPSPDDEVVIPPAP